MSSAGTQVDVPLLIVNADDFGLSPGVNRGIIDAHRNGIVTSASLMVRAPASAHAAALARMNPRLGLGLHVDFGEWALRDNEWLALYERVAEGDADSTVVELEAQLALFVELTGAPPDHLDSHQHLHLSRPELNEAVARAADRLGIGVRGIGTQVAYQALYGQDREGRTLLNAIEPAAYVEAIRGLAPGITELACHPGHADGLASDYRMEREVELRSLCDARVRAAVEERGVRLVTWSDVRAPARPVRGAQTR